MSSRLSRTLRNLLSGHDEGRTDYVEAMRNPGDAGLYGPGSVTWKVMGCPATLIGGVRALVVQSLDPLTVAGVMGHSRFRQDPIGRLQTTARFVTVASFASTDQIEAECATIRAVHRRVRGQTADGRTYSATDPFQLRLVHLALVDSFLAAHQWFAPERLNDRDVDTFIAEQNRIAPYLGFADIELPRTRAELDRILGEHARHFAVGADAADALEFLADPPLPGPVKAGYRAVLCCAVASIPEPTRKLLPRSMPDCPQLPARIAGRALVEGLIRTLGPSPALNAATERTATPHL